MPIWLMDMNVTKGNKGCICAFGYCTRWPSLYNYQFHGRTEDGIFECISLNSTSWHAIDSVELALWLKRNCKSSLHVYVDDLLGCGFLIQQCSDSITSFVTS